MLLKTMTFLIVLLLFVIISDSVKIGISKPATVYVNVTTEVIETTTLEPTTIMTSTSTSTSTTAKKIPSTKTTRSTTKSTPTSTSTTTTPIPSTSTTIAPQKNDSQLSSIRNQNVDRSRYFCSCDLRPHFCDINCCCDIDCIPEELNSFDCHKEETRLEDFYYQQGLPPCKINEGWLCVFRTNIDNSEKTHPNYIYDKSNFHEWPQLLVENNDLAKDRSFYKIGEPVLLYNLEINEIIEYDLPISLVGQHCQILESVRHLESKKTSCHLSLENAKTLETSLFQRLCTSFLLQRPNTPIPLDLDGSTKETPTEFIPITLFHCTEEFDCVKYGINSSSYDIFDDSGHSCLIEARIVHNITNLISCEVFFVRSDEKSDPVWQNYEVKFVHVNETEDARTSNVSGALGYNSGSPLIIGHKVLLNESADTTDSNRVLSYFHPNRTNQIHIHIPKRSQDSCEESQLTVNFAESILVQCSVQLENSTELTSETNFTKICGELQDRSLQFLQVRDILRLQEDFFISTLGYPANKTDYWTKIEVRNYEHLPVIGNYLDKEDAFICQNMILGLIYQFLIVNENVHGVRHQNLLQQAWIEMGTRHDLQFQFDELVSIPISFATIFQDMQEVSNGVELSSSWCVVFISIVVAIYYSNLNLNVK